MSRHENYATKMAVNFRYEFTTEQMSRDLGIRIRSADAKIRKMRKNHEIITPLQSFHVILPPEYRKNANFPAIQYIDPLMKHLEESYYIGLLSAAAMHGASHQSPMVFQVVVKDRRRMIRCGGSQIEFIVRNNMDRMPFMEITTERGKAKAATPELTAFELIGYQKNSGGMVNVAIMLIEMSDELSARELKRLAGLQPISWVQRLGFVLERIGEYDLANSLFPIVRKKALSWSPLIRSMETKKCERDEKWGIIVNSELEPDYV